MNEWLQLFLNKDDNVELVIISENKTLTLKKSDFKKIGNGSEKVVYGIKNSRECFFIPSMRTAKKPQNDWEELIVAEKHLLDQISELGLKTQHFEIVSLQVSQGTTSHTIKGLLTTNLAVLCEEESIAICTIKDKNKCIGLPPNFVAMEDKLNNQVFVQKMFKEVINEFVTCLAFSLPISQVKNVDDSEHFYFKLSQDQNEPPVLHYIFWDVANDFSGIKFPVVPTLDFLKANTKYGDSLLKYFANQVAGAMVAMNLEDIDDDVVFVQDTEAKILKSINNDEFLNSALNYVREKSFDYLNKYLTDRENNKNIYEIKNDTFVSLIESAISIGNLDLVKRSFAMYKNPSDLSNDAITKITTTAKQYGNQNIMDYLNNKLDQQYAEKDIGPRSLSLFAENKILITLARPSNSENKPSL